jgi:hypothetical protein
MTKASLIWNRACAGARPEAAAGDRALSALLRVHGLVMNGGVLHAVECLTPTEIEEAASAYQFFRFDAAARLLVQARLTAESAHSLSENEGLLDSDYHRLIPDDSKLYARFDEHRCSHPQDFAPINESSTKC